MTKGARSWRFADLSALARLRLGLRSYLAAAGASDGVTADVVLAVQEAGKNAVRAGSGAAVTVRVWIDGDSLWISVKDRGTGLAPRRPTRCPSPWSTHGRGLCLMGALMDEVRIERAHGTRLIMRRALSAGLRRPSGQLPSLVA